MSDCTANPRIYAHKVNDRATVSSDCLRHSLLLRQYR
jgi:hypothetical protein